MRPARLLEIQVKLLRHFGWRYTYKLCTMRDGVVGSFSSYGIVEYELNKITYPSIKNSRLFGFVDIYWLKCFAPPSLLQSVYYKGLGKNVRKQTEKIARVSQGDILVPYWENKYLSECLLMVAPPHTYSMDAFILLQKLKVEDCRLLEQDDN